MTVNTKSTTVLITGVAGQLGGFLGRAFKKYPQYRTIGADLVSCEHVQGIVDKVIDHPVNVIKQQYMRRLIEEVKPDWVIHLPALLSGTAEKKGNFKKTLQLNIDSLTNLLQLATKYKFGVFCPSSIAAFGNETPKVAQNETVMRPKFLYGITKVYNELMGEYFWQKHGVDYRSLRLPGVLAESASMGQGTTDYAVEMMNAAAQALQHNNPYAVYQCYLREDTRLPMVHIDDCVEGIIQFINTPRNRLSRTVYNINSMSFTPAELASEISRWSGIDMRVRYDKIDETRQSIADSWPSTMGDEVARRDWNWDPKIDIAHTVKRILANGSANKTLV